jgi:hypothetical protein
MKRAYRVAPAVIPPAVGLLCVALLAGCKGEVVYKDTPDTLAKLESLTQQLAAKEKDTRACQDQLATLQRNQAGGAELIVTIEGDALKIKARKGGDGGAPIDEATAAKQSQAFLDIVSRSRGAIQKCYEQALKKNTGLQAVTVSMTLSASFTAAGEFSRMSTSRSLGDTFDTCLRGVATKWKLPAAPQSMTFQAQVSLSPT